jgi:hypothetical protein
MKHLIIGMGEVGQSLLSFALSNGCQAAGRDLVESGQREADVLHVAYPYGAEFVSATAAYLDAYRPQSAIIHSTVIPGTTESVAERAGCPIAYSPVRGRHDDDGQMVRDLGHYVKFYATDGADLAGEDLQEMGFNVERFNSVRGLELAKLCETTYTGLLIAWAQEMDRYCTQQSADFEELHKFLAEPEYLPRFMFQPGYIGGHCILPNIDLLNSLRESSLLDAILISNDVRALELGKPDGKRYRPVPLGEL